eukprot:765289-Hanusia_phi.AAC.1
MVSLTFSGGREPRLPRISTTPCTPSHSHRPPAHAGERAVVVLPEACSPDATLVTDGKRGAWAWGRWQLQEAEATLKALGPLAESARSLKDSRSWAWETYCLGV